MFSLLGVVAFSVLLGKKKVFFSFSRWIAGLVRLLLVHSTFTFWQTNSRKRKLHGTNIIFIQGGSNNMLTILKCNNWLKRSTTAVFAMPNPLKNRMLS